MRSSTRSGFAADANGGAVIDCEAIRSSLPVPCAEEAAIDEGFDGFRRTPQRRNDAASRVTIQSPNDISARRNPTRTVACASAERPDRTRRDDGGLGREASHEAAEGHEEEDPEHRER